MFHSRRLIPIPLPHRKKQLESVRGVPKVCPEVLARRLHFLLGPAAIEQQKMARMQVSIRDVRARVAFHRAQAEIGFSQVVLSPVLVLLSLHLREFSSRQSLGEFYVALVPTCFTQKCGTQRSRVFHQRLGCFLFAV